MYIYILYIYILYIYNYIYYKDLSQRLAKAHGRRVGSVTKSSLTCNNTEPTKTWRWWQPKKNLKHEPTKMAHFSPFRTKRNRSTLHRWTSRIRIENPWKSHIHRALLNSTELNFRILLWAHLRLWDFSPQIQWVHPWASGAFATTFRKRKVAWARHGTPFDTNAVLVWDLSSSILGPLWIHLDPIGSTWHYFRLASGSLQLCGGSNLAVTAFRCPFCRWYNRAQYTSYTSSSSSSTSSVYIRVRSVCDAWMSKVSRQFTHLGPFPTSYFK